MLSAGDLTLFGTAHVGAIITTAAAACILVGFLRATAGMAAAPRIRRITCFLLATALLAMWLIHYSRIAWSGLCRPSDDLPLHLCDFALAISVLALYGVSAPPAWRTRRFERALQVIYELAYYWGLGATPQAILTPDIHDGFPTFMCIRFFFTHGGIVVAVLVMTLGLSMRPGPWSVVRTWALTVGLGVVMMLINWLVRGNYMFVCGPPARESLYDYLGKWPWTLLSLSALAAIVFTALYAPFWLARRAVTRRPDAPPASPQ